VRTAADVEAGPDEVETTPTPTAAELDLIRTFDPDGFWTGGE
jgi:glutaconate CoA-transferase subunit B